MLSTTNIYETQNLEILIRGSWESFLESKFYQLFVTIHNLCCWNLFLKQVCYNKPPIIVLLLSLKIQYETEILLLYF